MIVPSPLSVCDRLAPFAVAVAAGAVGRGLTPFGAAGRWSAAPGQRSGNVAGALRDERVDRRLAGAWRTLDMPFVSAFPNLSANVASHFLKSGDPPVFTALPPD